MTSTTVMTQKRLWCCGSMASSFMPGWKRFLVLGKGSEKSLRGAALPSASSRWQCSRYFTQENCCRLSSHSGFKISSSLRLKPLLPKWFSLSSLVSIWLSHRSITSHCWKKRVFQRKHKNVSQEVCYNITRDSVNGKWITNRKKNVLNARMYVFHKTYIYVV